jgi:hypothetical protein
VGDWHERDHPRNPDTGEFVPKELRVTHNEFSDAWAKRISDGIGETLDEANMRGMGGLTPEQWNGMPVEMRNSMRHKAEAVLDDDRSSVIARWHAENVLRGLYGALRLREGK